MDEIDAVIAGLTKAQDGCPATFGRESASHSWITVSRSSYRVPPYVMCSKCGTIRARLQEQTDA